MPGGGPVRGATRGSPPAPARRRPSRGRCGGSWWHAASRQLQGGRQLRDVGELREQRVQVPRRGQSPGPALLVDRPKDLREDPLHERIAEMVPEPGRVAESVRPREEYEWDAGVDVERQGERGADERQPQVFGHAPAGHLDLIDDKGVDALFADRVRGVPEEHLRVQHQPMEAVS
jgi:hypothetical protein